MPRQVRIEYAGAMYHVMARGNRREAIVRDDEDRRTFLKTLGQACGRAGFRVHAYVLMDNHYHLLLETPAGNLSEGMGWLQNAYTRRMNVRHKLWGHLFGGRYKAILVEPGTCFWTLLDYIHLNPVRAGMVEERNGLESYQWSSVRDYLSEPAKRPAWVETQMGFGVAGCPDTAAGRREFLAALEGRVDWRAPGKAGVEMREGDEAPELGVHVSLRRGWYFGSQKFKEKILELAGAKIGEAARRKADGYTGGEVTAHGEERALRIRKAGLEHFAIEEAELEEIARSDWRKGVIAALIHQETTMRLDWISEQLKMGTRSGCCRTIGWIRREIPKHRDWKEAREAILKMSTFHDCPLFLTINVQKNSYRLQRVSGIEEIASLINCPYNKPTFTDAQSKEMFREEYECADHILRSELRKLGEVDAIGAKEFSMGDPWNSSRKIGVTVNVNRLFSEKLIELLKDAVEQMPARYLVILSGEYESGAGTFYICINRDREVLGYSPNKKILDLFGFI